VIYTSALQAKAWYDGMTFKSNFYQRVSIASYASAGIARAEMSICLSVRPSHSGIVSKRRKLAS